MSCTCEYAVGARTVFSEVHVHRYRCPVSRSYADMHTHMFMASCAHTPIGHAQSLSPAHAQLSCEPYFSHAWFMAICQTRERAAALSYTLCTKQRGRSHQRPASRTLLLYLGRQLLHTNGEVAPVGVEEGAVMVPQLRHHTLLGRGELTLLRCWRAREPSGACSAVV